ncbi:MAG: zinc ribbon domain-containing protein [Candidatus Geothermarchaeales archaeon]
MGVRGERSYEILRSAIKLLISLIVLGIIRAISVGPPGVNVPIPNIPITVATAVDAVIGVAMIAVVLKFGREIAPPTRDFFPSYPETAAVASNAVRLGAIWIAYVSFRSLILGLMPELWWVYPLAFLTVAIIPTYRVAAALFRGIDRWTNLIIRKIREAAEEYVTCPSCGRRLAAEAKFCSHCGIELTKSQLDTK